MFSPAPPETLFAKVNFCDDLHIISTANGLFSLFSNNLFHLCEFGSYHTAAITAPASFLLPEQYWT